MKPTTFSILVATLYLATLTTLHHAAPAPEPQPDDKDSSHPAPPPVDLPRPIDQDYGGGHDDGQWYPGKYAGDDGQWYPGKYEDGGGKGADYGGGHMKKCDYHDKDKDDYGGEKKKCDCDDDYDKDKDKDKDDYGGEKKKCDCDDDYDKDKGDCSGGEGYGEEDYGGEGYGGEADYGAEYGGEDDYAADYPPASPYDYAPRGKERSYSRSRERVNQWHDVGGQGYGKTYSRQWHGQGEYHLQRRDMEEEKPRGRTLVRRGEEMTPELEKRSDDWDGHWGEDHWYPYHPYGYPYIRPIRPLKPLKPLRPLKPIGGYDYHHDKYLTKRDMGGEESAPVLEKRSGGSHDYHDYHDYHWNRHPRPWIRHPRPWIRHPRPWPHHPHHYPKKWYKKDSKWDHSY